MRIGGMAAATVTSARKRIRVFIGATPRSIRGKKLHDINRDVPIRWPVADDHHRRFPGFKAKFSEADEALLQRRGGALIHADSLAAFRGLDRHGGIGRAVFVRAV